MDKDNNQIDLGTWNVPTSWDEVTLGMVQRMKGKTDIKSIIAAVTNHDMDEVNQLPINILMRMGDMLKFINTPPTPEQPCNSIMIKNSEYTIHFENELRTGEFIAVDSILRSNPDDTASILAILCRKKDEIYDSNFENTLLEERREMFLNQPIMHVLPLVDFFLALWSASELPFLLYSQLKDQINHMLKNIEISRKNGEVSARSMRHAKKILKKSLITINHMFTTGSSSKPTWWKRLMRKRRKTNSRTTLEKVKKDNIDLYWK